MYRYVALAWAAGDPAARADAELLGSRLVAQWTDARQVVDEDGLAAFAPTADLSSWQTLVQAGRGVIFGRVFRNGRETEASSPSREEWSRIGATGGRHLLEAWWGRYVAIFRTGCDGGVSVLRDPSSGLPCFIACHRRVWVIFSDISVCRALLALSVNWQFVAAYLKTGGIPTDQTGFIEVTEVQPGERVVLSPQGMHRESLWDPLDAALNQPIESPAAAIAAVRETVERCVHAWASLHRSIVHMLSGGLDSSVVLSCLASASSRPDVVCLHLVSSVAHEEEHHYARLAAEQMGCELREFHIGEIGTDLSQWMPRLRAAVRPVSAIHEALTGAMSAQVAAESHATAVVSGAAGDSLFFQPAAEFATADFVRRHRLRRAVWPVAWNAARLSGEAIWPVLWRAISRRALNRSLQRNFSALNADQVVKSRHLRRLPPGLSAQLLGMSASVPFYSHFDQAGRQPDRCPVLLSQPLMELCLRIASHVWIAGGCDRAIVREAFAERIPGAIRTRTAKGSADECYGQLLDLNAGFVRESLLDGRLAREGWIDPKWIASQFSGSRLRGLELDRILHRYLSTEFWLRSWDGAGASRLDFRMRARGAVGAGCSANGTGSG